ncbi:MAG: XRE family transcriptional regulator [Pedobacter sp.]|nr:MAG: XRE family transcriptional regulator [Pedobacter sp.]
MTKEEQHIFYKQLGRKICTARKTANMKQEYLALQIGLTRTSLVNIEQGNQRIQLHALLALISVLEIDIIDLIPEIINSKPQELNWNFEKNISKEIDQNFEDVKQTREKLKNFYNLTQNKK